MIFLYRIGNRLISCWVCSGEDQVDENGGCEENARRDHQKPDVLMLFAGFPVLKVAILEGSGTLLPVEEDLLQAFCAVDKACEHVHIANNMYETVGEEHHADQEEQIYNIKKAGSTKIMPQQKGKQNADHNQSNGGRPKFTEGIFFFHLYKPLCVYMFFGVQMIMETNFFHRKQRNAYYMRILINWYY